VIKTELIVYDSALCFEFVVINTVTPRFRGLR